MSSTLEQPAGLAHASLFRFATAGSVDDGKSTLVGRLLHDSKSVLADQLDAVARISADRGFGGETGGHQLDLALLTDGLRSEREQGITIDVAYRYFATADRSFILADCPGHVQYTRNTVTGASTADAVVVLIDARKGVLEQTRRHLAVLALLRVPNVVVAVNKIDLVGFDAGVFHTLEADVEAVAADMGVESVNTVPVSALEGDNVVKRSARTPWYTGPTLLELLESLPTIDEVELYTAEAGQRAVAGFRFPIQSVVRPQGALAAGLEPEAFRDYRGYAGQIAGGSISVGDLVVASSRDAGWTTTVTGIDFAGTELATAAAPQSVVLRLADDVDLGRGDLIAAAGTEALPQRELTGAVCWLSSRPVREGARVLVKHGTRTVQGLIRSIDSVLDLDSFAWEPAEHLALNDVGRLTIRLASPLPVEDYVLQRRTGAFLIVDAGDGGTLAAGMVSLASGLGGGTDAA